MPLVSVSQPLIRPQPERLAERTPGIASMRSRTCLDKPASWFCLYPLGRGSMLKSSTFSRSNPGSTLNKFWRLPTSNPAPISNNSDNATCETTRPLFNHNLDPLLVRLLLLPLSASLGSSRVARNAGASPKRIPVSTAIPAVKPSTRKSKVK